MMKSQSRGTPAPEPPLRRRPPGIQVPLVGLQVAAWNYRAKCEPTPKYPRFLILQFHMFGKLDTKALERAVESLIHRHEPLRTRILEVSGRPSQYIDEVSSYELEIVDVPGRSGSGADTKLLEVIGEFVEEEVLWEVGPLFAAKLFKVSDQEHVLAFSIDHMISDFLSKEMIGIETFTLYDEGKTGKPSSLPEVTLQFADYAVWQQQRSGLWLANNERYWRQHLAGSSRVKFPFDSRSTEEHPTVSMSSVQLRNTLSIRLRDIARQQNTTLALVALTLFIVSISYWCDQRDMTMTFVDHGRYSPGLFRMIGYLTNHLTLRIEVSRADTLSSLLDRVTGELWSARRHQDCNQVNLLIPDCGVDVTDDDFYFNWLPTPERPVMAQSLEADHGIVVRPFEIKPREREGPKPTFAVFGSEIASPGSSEGDEHTEGIGMVISIWYRGDRFACSTMENFAKRLEDLANQFAQCPQASITSVSGL